MPKQDIIQSLRQQLNVTYAKPDPSRVDILINNLKNNQIALNYLKITRGFTDETIKHFKLGYSKDKDAISIPVFKNNELINIKYRLLNSKTIKYIQEKDCEIWLFNEEGIDIGKKKGGVMITEGEFDCMSVWQSGIKNVVSPASGKDSYGMWIELIDNIPKAYICYDNDSAGKKSSKEMAERLGVDKSYEIQYPEGIKDANEYFKEHTPEEFRELVKEARPFYKYVFKTLGDVLSNLRNPQNSKDILSSKFIPDVKLRKQFLINIAARTGQGKCHAKGTKLLMYDGSVKNVEDVIVGDKLMGQDSKPKTILSLANGVEEMYRINEGDSGEYYDVNESHIVSIKKVSWDEKTKKTKIIYYEKSVSELLDIKPCTRRHYRGWKTDVDFKEQELKLAPYFLGIWLGDGTSSKAQITSMDKVIKDFIFDYSHSLNLDVTIRKQPNNKAVRIDIVNKTRKKGSNHVLNSLRHYNLIDNKHIPSEYKVNSYENRLQILAGLLDSDGHLSGVTSNFGQCFEITQKNTELANDIVFLARSLGFKVKIKKVERGIKSINFVGEYNRIHIMGDISRIPTRLKRKQTNFNSKKSWMTHRLDIESLGVGEYFGFTLDGDGLYLLENFTVTHNTTYALNIVDDLSAQGQSVLFLPLENGIDFVGQRLINILSGISDDDFPNTTDDQWSKVIRKIVDREIYFAMAKQDDIFETMLKAKRFFNTKIIIIDLIEELLKDSTENEVKAMDRLMYAFKSFAIDNDVIIMVVSHIKKDSAQGASIEKPPTLSDIRGSGSLINVPHCVVIINQENDMMKVEVAKNKGKENTSYFSFDRETGRLSSGQSEPDNPNLTKEENDLWGDNK